MAACDVTLPAVLLTVTLYEPALDWVASVIV
jgi:hypothetical protein